MKAKSKRKISRRSLIKKLDKLFSIKIRARGFCQLKGKDKIKCGGVLQTAHIIGRGRHIIRWNELNALCVCQGHHVYYTHQPLEWNELMLRFYYKQFQAMILLKDQEWDKDLAKIEEQLSQE